MHSNGTYSEQTDEKVSDNTLRKKEDESPTDHFVGKKEYHLQEKLRKHESED